MCGFFSQQPDVLSLPSHLTGYDYMALRYYATRPGVATLITITVSVNQATPLSAIVLVRLWGRGLEKVGFESSCTYTKRPCSPQVANFVYTRT